MKNFKKIALGLMVGAMAIGFSAFTNAHTIKKGKTTYYYYVLDSSSGEYLWDYSGTTPPSDATCAGHASYNCVIGYTTNEGTSPLDPTKIPTPNYTSGGLAYFQ